LTQRRKDTKDRKDFLKDSSRLSELLFRGAFASREPVMNEFLLILGMTLVTFGVRYPVLALVGRLKLPEVVLRALRFVPPAVLSAIIFPAVFYPDGVQLRLGLDNPRVLAVIIAGLVAWRSKNLLLTIVVGMVALWVLQVLM
jgi:branched-subunit amino acid transport protein